jgi:2-polyprenyl-3-methyl-5-hydroxy-6-metoxy-1,4-benzoquinol methylase
MNRRDRRAARKLDGAGHAVHAGAVWPLDRAGTGVVDALAAQGRDLLARGDDEAALLVACRAIQMEETPATRALFVRAVNGFAYFPGAGDMQPVLARAVREAWAWPNQLLSVTLGVLGKDRLIGEALERAGRAWPRRLCADELLGPGGLAAIARSPLLLAVLESVQVPDRAFERFLTGLRSAVLDAAAAAQGAADDGVTGLASALAQQCFINEYVFAVTDEENARVLALRDAVQAALDRGAPAPPLQLAALGAYGRLDMLLPAFANGGAKGGQRARWPKSLAPLIDQQVAFPALLQRQRGDVPRLTPIIHEVSQAVRQQYEENPFPRWVRSPIDVTAVPLAAFLRREFPHATVAPLPGPERTGAVRQLDILVAGCGTGQQPIDFAQRHAGAKVLAIDLSLSSLAYARIKTAAAGLANIDYAQADILELASLGRTFDLVVSGGVLHHLADPLAGWRVLTTLMRPNGLMYIGLYSEAARRGIVAAREWIAAKGYPATPDGIRACRQEMACIDDPAWNSIFTLLDFYSMSECRDLLFHVQEHRFTLPQIGAFLAENDLKLLGFLTPAKVMRRFRARFPAPEHQGDIACWHAFETENPDAFINMYHLWVQKNSD